MDHFVYNIQSLIDLLSADRKLHDSKEHVAISTECPEENEIVQVPLKRKVRTTSASGPTYKG